MRTLHLLLLITVAFCGCLNQKFLAKNQFVFKIEPSGNGKSEIKAYNTGNNKLQVGMSDSLGFLFIKKKDTAGTGFILPTVIESSFTPTAQYEMLSANKDYYFPELVYPQAGDANSNNLFIPPKKLKYYENNVIFQLVTTPLKVRPAITTKKRFKDSLGTQALAELNIGAAFGLKRSWYVYKARPNENGQNKSSVSLSGSFFLSIGGTNVKPITTRNFTQVDKTQPVASFGAIFSFGFNNLDIGISVGKDHLLVPSISSKWIYDGVIWYGLTLAYDIWK